MLGKRQVEQFRRDGYLVAKGAVTGAQLSSLRGAIASWIEESRDRDEPYGPPTVDRRPRSTWRPSIPARARRFVGSTIRPR